MTPATLLLHDERREWVAYLREEAAGHGALLRRALRSRTQVCHLPGRGGRRGRVRVAARSRVSWGDPEPDPDPTVRLEPLLTLARTSNKLTTQVCYLYAEYAEDASGKEAVRVDVQDEGPGDLGW